jgi:hypothetical protein
VQWRKSNGEARSFESQLVSGDNFMDSKTLFLMMLALMGCLIAHYIKCAVEVLREIRDELRKAKSEEWIGRS